MASWLKALPSRAGDQCWTTLSLGSRTNHASTQQIIAATHVMKIAKRSPDHSSPHGVGHVRPLTRSMKFSPSAPPKFINAYCKLKAKPRTRRLVSFLMATMYSGSQTPSAMGPRPVSTNQSIGRECVKTRIPLERTPRVVAVSATARMPQRSTIRLPTKPQTVCSRPHRPYSCPASTSLMPYSLVAYRVSTVDRVKYLKELNRMITSTSQSWNESSVSCTFMAAPSQTARFPEVLGRQTLPTKCGLQY
mmetsp:Transcript_72879/g.187942  ORF Transcript_72879/g.187942 Transcript_72879/m.187942 type:complete len:248 (-) Transcript_72879:78-821(-)